MNPINFGHWIIKKIISSSWYVTLLNFGTNILFPSKLPNSINTLLQDNKIKEIVNNFKYEIKPEIVVNDLWYYKILYYIKTFWIDAYAFVYSYLIYFKANQLYSFLFTTPYNYISTFMGTYTPTFISTPLGVLFTHIIQFSTWISNNIVFFSTPQPLQIIFNYFNNWITYCSVSLFGVFTIVFLGLFVGPISTVTGLFGASMCLVINKLTTILITWATIDPSGYISYMCRSISLIISVVSTYKFRQYVEGTWISIKLQIEEKETEINE